MQLGELDGGGFDLARELGHLAVLQARGFLVVVASLGVFELHVRRLEPLFGRTNLLDQRLFTLPVSLGGGRLFADLGHLRLELFKPLLADSVGLARERRLFDLELLQTPLELVDLGGQAVDLDAQPARRFVDQVHGLVRQEPVGDVAVGQRGRRHERRILDAHAVVHLVLLLEAAQDADRVGDRRLIDVHGLKASLERGVLFDVLAVFIERRRAHTPQLTARKGRLEHVAGVHRAFARPGADHRVHLVDKADDLAVAGR